MFLSRNDLSGAAEPIEHEKLPLSLEILKSLSVKKEVLMVQLTDFKSYC